jgi:hypothetical protein
VDQQSDKNDDIEKDIEKLGDQNGEKEQNVEESEVKEIIGNDEAMPDANQK